jgi:hypothetical protein
MSFHIKKGKIFVDFHFKAQPCRIYRFRCNLNLTFVLQRLHLCSSISQAVPETLSIPVFINIKAQPCRIYRFRCNLNLTFVLQRLRLCSSISQAVPETLSNKQYSSLSRPSLAGYIGSGTT